MKKSIISALALVLCACVLFSGCAPIYSKAPDEYTDIRWISYDYNFCINPEDDCNGYYTFNGNKYDIHVKFESSHLTATDTANDKELFNADWTYEKNDSGDTLLYIYNISFNKKDYEDFKTNYAEFVNLKQEKL